MANNTQNLHLHKNGRYYAIFCQDGKQRWISLRTSSLRKARAKLHKLKIAENKASKTVAAPLDGESFAAIKNLILEMRLELADLRAQNAGTRHATFADGKAPEPLPSDPSLIPANRIDFPSAVSRHFLTLTFGSQKTWQMYHSQKSLLLKLCADWEHFSPAVLWNRSQLGNGHRRPPGHSSLNHFRIYLCVLTTWMVTEGWIVEQLAKEARAIVRKKVHSRKPVIPRTEQIATLLQQIEMEDRETGQFFRFLTYTGARIGSALKVKWSNVHWDMEQIDFCLKGDEEKAIFLHLKALDLLRKRHEERMPDLADRIFPFDENWIRGARALLRKWAEALGLQITIPHMLRHYHASRLLMDKVDMASVSAQLGHSNVQTTMKAYIHSLPSHIQDRLKEANL